MESTGRLYRSSRNRQGVFLALQSLISSPQLTGTRPYWLLPSRVGTQIPSKNFMRMPEAVANRARTLSSN